MKSILITFITRYQEYYFQPAINVKLAGAITYFVTGSWKARVCCDAAALAVDEPHTTAPPPDPAGACCERVTVFTSSQRPGSSVGGRRQASASEKNTLPLTRVLCSTLSSSLVFVLEFEQEWQLY